jgi:hypothetical protein
MSGQDLPPTNANATAAQALAVVQAAQAAQLKQAATLQLILEQMQNMQHLMNGVKAHHGVNDTEEMRDLNRSGRTRTSTRDFYDDSEESNDDESKSGERSIQLTVKPPAPFSLTLKNGEHLVDKLDELDVY